MVVKIFTNQNYLVKKIFLWHVNDVLMAYYNEWICELLAQQGEFWAIQETSYLICNGLTWNLG